MKSYVVLAAFFFVSRPAFAQAGSPRDDSIGNEQLKKMVTLSEVVVRNNVDVARFLRFIRNDTTFYKAFRTLHVIGFTSLNDIRMRDKAGAVKASLQSRTIQHVAHGCRTMQTVDQQATGNMLNSGGGYQYYTAELYASLFFTTGEVCGENNIVRGTEHSTRQKSGIEKHKEQLKMLFFDPGKKIPGIPFIGNKINIFDPEVARYYDYHLDLVDYNGQDCYLFTIRARDDLTVDERNNVVIDNITTWIDRGTMEVVGRNYDI
ncbi:MAG TPA: hypothetical protein VGC95_10660, partial [Chitinophagaceae bacterium]